MVPNSPHSQVTISIESLASSFESMLSGDLSMSPRVCIFRIPKILYKHNPQAYEPIAYSIGPFRYGDDNLKPTENIKMKYLKGLLRRSTNSKELLRKLTGAVRAMEQEARQCYAGSSIGTCSDEEFIKILVLDGCFIIELFRKDADEVIKDPDDPIFTMSCFLEFLKHDLVLLENQIPWPVLECLFDMTMVPGGHSLIALALEFFINMFSSLNKPTIKPDLFAELEIKHILDMLRLSLILPLDRLNMYSRYPYNPLPCARKINGSGLKFKKVNPDTILDIRFSNGFLEIPPLLVHGTTETVFLNLISLEQCLPYCPPIITSYANLMDNLIDTIEDLEIMCDNDVLDSRLNPEDATRVFNKLNNDTYVQGISIYDNVFMQVNSYGKRWWPKWRYFYILNYFTAPWAIVSQIVAVIFLILGFLQTCYTIVGYLSDKKKGT